MSDSTIHWATLIPAWLSAIAGSVTAIYFSLGYHKILVNKLNEQQLNTVIEVVKEIRSLQGFKSTQQIYQEYNDGITDLMGIYDFKYCVSVVIDSQKFNELEKKLNEYINNPILPHKIANKLKKFLSKVQKTSNKNGSYIKYPALIQDHSSPQYKGIYILYLRQYVGEIIVAIDDWLWENQVKDINLPKLDKEYIRRNDEDRTKYSRFYCLKQYLSSIKKALPFIFLLNNSCINPKICLYYGLIAYDNKIKMK